MSDSIITTQWEALADQPALDATVEALAANGFNPIVVKTADEAQQAVLDLLPEGIDVFTARSATLAEMGLTQAIDESGRYDSIRARLASLDRATQVAEMRRLGATPSYVVGSVHAVTRQGHVLVASAGGSQLTGYVAGAGKVIWVVGTQKLVADLDEGLRRIEEHCLPLESQRLQAAMGMPSFIGKIAIFRKEAIAGRITIILVKQKLGV